MLDHHLACEVMTAVELRRPFLIAANTGLTAWISGSGRIVQQTQRLDPAFVIAEPTADSRFGLSQVWGDLPAWCMALIALGAIGHKYFTRKAIAISGKAGDEDETSRSDRSLPRA